MIVRNLHSPSSLILSFLCMNFIRLKWIAVLFPALFFSSFFVTAQETEKRQPTVQENAAIMPNDSVVFINGFSPADTLGKLIVPRLRHEGAPRPGQVKALPGRAGNQGREMQEPEKMVTPEDSPPEAAEWIRRLYDEHRNDPVVQTGRVEEVMARPPKPGESDHSVGEDTLIFLDPQYRTLHKTHKSLQKGSRQRVNPENEVRELPPVPAVKEQLPVIKLESAGMAPAMEQMNIPESAEEAAMVNLPPVAIPDVYMTEQGVAVTVDAPGHLGNDYDINGDEVTWITYQVPANGTVTDPVLDGSFVYTPDPGFSGIDSFEVTITDGNGNTASGRIAILVKDNASPQAVPDVYVIDEGETLVVDEPGHLANDNDPDGDPLTWLTYTPPSNGTITDPVNDGTFTYTPDAGFSGIESISVTITDGKGNISMGQIIILVKENRSPVAVPDVYTTNQGEPLVVTAPGHLANDYDPEGGVLQWISYSIPSSGNVSGTNSDGSFTYTPDPGFSGQESFTVAVVDDQGNVAFGEVVITVISDSQRPPVAIADVFVTDEGVPLVVTAPGHLVNDYDPDGDPIEWISYSLPSNGSVSGTAPDGSFTYTPDPGFSGQDFFTTTITDGNGNLATGEVVITVAPLSGPVPVAIADVYTTQEGQSLIVSSPGHLANDYDPDGDPVEWISYTFPANGSMSGTTSEGGFTYTPDPGFSGQEAMDVTITDGNGNLATGRIVISVIASPNSPPVAVADVFTTKQGEPLMVTAPGHLANDFDPDGDPIEWISYTFPENGSMSGTVSEGGFTYTPNPGFSGIESMVVSITDGNGHVAMGRILILVEENLDPVAVPDVFVMNQGGVLEVTAPGHLANDYDPDGDPVEWISYTFPANGSMSGTTSEGGFTYTPDPGFSGIESFMVSITDGKGNIGMGLISIVVQENLPPVAVPDVYTTDQGQPLDVQAPGHLANDYDPEGDPLSWLTYQVPDNGVVSDPVLDGSFTYTPGSSFYGVDPIVVTITDGQGNVAQGLVMIAVVPNYPPVALAGEDFVVVAGQTAELDGTASYDPEGAALTYSWIFATGDTSDPLPSGSGAVLNGAGSATPSFVTDEPGFYSVQLTVNDGLQASAPDYVVVTALSVVQALENIGADILLLQSGNVLNMGQTKALTQKISQAVKLIEKEKIGEAVDVLQGLRQQVLDLWKKDGVLSKQQAEELITQVDVILSVLPPSLVASGSEMSTMAGNSEVPHEFGLSGVYPNPVVTSARLVFSLPARTSLTIGLFDVYGRQVRELVSGHMDAGIFSVDLSASGLESGTYIIRMIDETGAAESRRIVISR